MRMLAITVQVTVRTDPFEIVLRRQNNFVIAAVVNVLQFSIINQKLKRFGIVLALANLKHEVQVRSGEMKALKARVFVVLIQTIEISQKG